MVNSICIPNETLIVLMDNKIDIEFLGFSMHDFWSTVRLTKEIADIIINQKLEWRYNHFGFCQ